MALTTVALGEKSWQFDDEKITLGEAFQIKSGTGLALKPFFEGVNEMDPLCLQGLIWWLRRRDGEASLSMADVDFVVGDLRLSQEEVPPQ